jgi:phosphatidylglycerol:prolipoprotein diacylglycerol transferase
MFPVIAQWGSFRLYSYGLFVAAAFLVGILWATRRAGRTDLPPFPFFEMGVYGGLFCIIGARFLFVLTEWPHFSKYPGEIFRLWDGGLILYGGVIASLLFSFFFLHRVRLPFWKSLDIYAPSLPLGLAIGRLGCFFNGCCYGLRSDTWGLSFPSAHHPPVFLQQVRDGLIKIDSLRTLPVLPTQLFSAATDVTILFVLLGLERKSHFPGFLFWTFVLLYSLARGFIEFFRYHDPGEMISAFSPLSLSQVISIAFLLSSLFMLFLLKLKNQGGVS